jgi:ArsR family transcriptional regulator, arsenate/arsenite/antimonite-responsive transcriptional repressor / arsenate reductase (thioredoxin)
VIPPPAFLQLAGHPLRWRLLGELARSDRQVQELTAALGEAQNLVSYHLAKLRAAGLVSMRRSSADRRDAYYRLDLAGCADLLAETGAALHPALRLTAPPPPVRRGRRPRVLFLCTGNSARSQMAEALLDRQSAGAVVAYSAGSHPKALHPSAVRAMREHGIDISGHRVKHLGEFAGKRFAVVVTLCDRVREVCPEFPGEPDLVHWSMPDPSAGPPGTDTYPAFQAVARDLSTRIRFLRHRIQTPSSWGHHG